MGVLIGILIGFGSGECRMERGREREKKYDDDYEGFGDVKSRPDLVGKC